MATYITVPVQVVLAKDYNQEREELIGRLNDLDGELIELSKCTEYKSWNEFKEQYHYDTMRRLGFYQEFIAHVVEFVYDMHKEMKKKTDAYNLLNELHDPTQEENDRLEKENGELREEINDLNVDIEDLNVDIEDLKEEIDHLKEEIKGYAARSALANEIDSLRESGHE